MELVTGQVGESCSRGVHAFPDSRICLCGYYRLLFTHDKKPYTKRIYKPRPKKR